MKTYESRDEMSPRMVQTLTQMMAGQAYRELAAAHLFGDGLKLVPELRWLKYLVWHVREEAEHYEAVAKMYAAFTGESVEPLVTARLREKPIDMASSWCELAMAQFLYDRGGYFQLREYEECAFLPYRAVVSKIVKEEAGHQRFGERILVELCRTGAVDDEKQRQFDKWFRQGMLSFGRPGTEGSKWAIENGLKRRDAAEVMQEFVDDIKPTMIACGLTFPDPAAIGLVVPDDLDFSLDGIPPHWSLSAPPLRPARIGRRPATFA
jgi:ring-1,2-phenylacetyl-CoA epoxidase subunit PaaA